jgi:hypothetical protein
VVGSRVGVVVVPVEAQVLMSWWAGGLTAAALMMMFRVYRVPGSSMWLCWLAIGFVAVLCLVMGLLGLWGVVWAAWWLQAVLLLWAWWGAARSHPSDRRGP